MPLTGHEASLQAGVTREVSVGWLQPLSESLEMRLSFSVSMCLRWGIC